MEVKQKFADSSQVAAWEERLKAMVEEICHLGPRYTPSQLGKAERYILNQLNKMGYSMVRLQPVVLEYGDMVESGAACLETSQMSNVIVAPQVVKPLHFVFLAHYDTLEWTVGADDNTSGVAAQLALCELFKKYTPQNMSVEFVFTVSEESDLNRPIGFGAREYFDDKQQTGEIHRVTCYINLDCLGVYYDESEDPLYECADVDEFSEFYIGTNVLYALMHPEFQVCMDIVAHWMMPDLAVEKLGDKTVDDLGTMSDIRWVFGTHPVIHFFDMAPLRNPFFHSRWDVPSVLNYTMFARAVLGIYGMVVQYALQKGDEYSIDDSSSLNHLPKLH